MMSKKKNQLFVRGLDGNIHPSVCQSVNIGIFYPTLTLMIDSYIICMHNEWKIRK